MPKSSSRVRIMPFPYGTELFDSRLKRIQEEPGAAGTDIVFTLDSFRPQSAPELCERDSRPHERLRGVYVPLRLRFTNASWVRRTGIYQDLDALPEDHSGRHLFGVQRSRRPDMGDVYWFATGAGEPGDLSLLATGSLLEPESGASRPVEIVRRWSPVPPLEPGNIPHRPALYRRYGGDPVAFRLGGRTYARRLFIGGLFYQQEERPLVHHVLNLCGLQNPWHIQSGESPHDRRVHRGEMDEGMDAMDIFEEAAWVTERLRAGRRVLVHCYAGINRSSTVCCATLMFLEGIGPEAALARIRQRHPQAWPDPYHWFTLRWMSQALDIPDVPNLPPAMLDDVAEDTEPQKASLLLEETPIG
ncbi:MAG: dual specificity protein phosphatase family protein [Ktedonobacterales bacterium]